MAFHKGSRSIVTRVATALRMVVESLADGMEPEVSERDVFQSIRPNVSEALRNFIGGAGDAALSLSTQSWVEQLASAARTTSTNGPDQLNVSARGVVVVLNMTVAVTAASLQLTVERKNAAGTYTQIAAAPAITVITEQRAVIVIDPLAGAEPAGVGDSVSGILPNEWRVRVVHGNANSHTYSVTAYPIR